MLARDGKPSMLLQQPGQMGPLRLKNRVVMGPMGTNFGTTDGFSTERDKIYYYAERARGGAAMIITEAMVVSGNARNHRASLCIFDDRFIPGLADLTKAIHDADALVCGQLNHRGMLLRRSLRWSLQSQHVNLLNHVSTAGHGTKKLDSERLREIEIPNPPLPLQKTFTGRVSEVRELEAEQGASRRQLDHLFQSMLHRAFNGAL
jgi:2,4-dienoyl-CoA reductase-like NADH-dependent reductase (Old Yellow Enzyme family)